MKSRNHVVLVIAAILFLIVMVMEWMFPLNVVGAVVEASIRSRMELRAVNIMIPPAKRSSRRRRQTSRPSTRGRLRSKQMTS